MPFDTTFDTTQDALRSNGGNREQKIGLVRPFLQSWATPENGYRRIVAAEGAGSSSVGHPHETSASSGKKKPERSLFSLHANSNLILANCFGLGRSSSGPFLLVPLFTEVQGRVIVETCLADNECARVQAQHQGGGTEHE